MTEQLIPRIQGSARITWPLTLTLSTTCMQAYPETIVCKFGRGPAICLWEEAFFVPAQKCPYHVTFDLYLSTPWMHADLESILWKFGGDPAIYLGEEAICAKVYRQTDGRTDRRRTPRHCINRDSRKSRQKMAKNTAEFCENRRNHGKNTAKTWHQITGPKTIIQSIKFNIQHCRPSLHAVHV